MQSSPKSRAIFNIEPRTLNLLLTIGALLGFVAATWVLKYLGGDDLYDCYRLFMYGDIKCVFVPPHARTVLLPILLPWPWAWMVWTILNGVLLMLLFRKMGQNPLPVLFSFPWVAQWWLGQIDIIPVVGIFILLFSQAFPLKFLGAWMALVKPHFLAVPTLLYAKSRKQNLIAVAMVILVSLIFWGIWPLEWLSRLGSMPIDIWRIASYYLAPLGIALIIIFRRNIHIVLAAIMLLPPSSIYTYFYLWAFPGVRGWLLTLFSWIWVLLYPVFGKYAVVLNVILPLMTIYFIYQQTERKTNTQVNDHPIAQQVRE